MYIKLEDVQAAYDKSYIPDKQKMLKIFNQREITHKQYEVQLWFCHTALFIIETKTNANFQAH